MPKIQREQKFFDLSDYGRIPAIYLSNLLKNTSVTPIQVTLCFGIIGLLSAYLIIFEYYFLASIGLILKSIVDAMDGELARIKERPSYSGRYLDSIFDYLLNAIFVAVIWYKSTNPFWAAIIAFICIQYQGTLYSYYYVILRHRSEGGDKTSKIFEMKPPQAFSIESQTLVNFLFKLFRVLYFPFDWMMYLSDSNAYRVRQIPNWFMSLISLYGLGFQLMIMALLLSFGLINYIIPFFITYTVLAFVFVVIRKVFI